MLALSKGVRAPSQVMTLQATKVSVYAVQEPYDCRLVKQRQPSLKTAAAAVPARHKDTVFKIVKRGQGATDKTALQGKGAALSPLCPKQLYKHQALTRDINRLYSRAVPAPCGTSTSD